VISIPKGELRVINTDPHNQKEKDLVPVLTPRGETMWVYPDIIENQQWMTFTSRKSKDKAKASSSNMVGISTRETEDVASLTSSGDEESAFAADTGTSYSVRQTILEIVWRADGRLPQPAEEIIEQSTRPSVKKQKELRYVKALQKGVWDHQLPSVLMS